MKILVIFSCAVAFCMAQMDFDMLNDDQKAAALSCLNENSMTQDQAEELCMDPSADYSSERRVCGCLALCIGHKLGFINADNTPNAEGMAEVSVELAEKMGLDLEKSAVVDITNKCWDKISSSGIADHCEAAFAMAKCGFEGIMDYLGM